MRKGKLNISAIFLLVVFLAGAVGVNVSRTYCNHCHIYRWQVFFISFEEDGGDVRFCSCCHTCKSRQAMTCENADNDYAYYKIDNSYSMKSHNSHLGDMPAVAVVGSPFGERIDLITNHFNLSVLYMDTSPPQEVLCTFRC